MSVVAEVCLYGRPASGYAFLTLLNPNAIASHGGWNTKEDAPSGELRSLTDTIELAKASLRALGVAAGDVRVFFPGGELATRTPIDVRQAVNAMTLGPAPRTFVTAANIAAAARAIAKTREKERYAEQWHPDYVTWYRPPSKTSSSKAPEPVSIFQGDLVWVAADRLLDGVGYWRIAHGFGAKTRSIQVGENEWAPLPRVYMRQEAIAAGVAPPRAPAKASHAAYPLLIDALALARGKTLELTADGRYYRLLVDEVSRDRGTITGPRSSPISVVAGTIQGTRVRLVLPNESDEAGAPLEPAELRWSAQRRAAVDPTSVRFVPIGAVARRSARLPSETVPPRSASRSALEREPIEPPPPTGSHDTPRPPADEWSRTGVVWYRPTRRGAGASQIEHRLGDLVWASYGASSVKKGSWGRIEGFSAARQAIKVHKQWRPLPLIFTYDEALALGIPAPRAFAPKAKHPDAWFPRLFLSLRRADAQGRTLDVTTTKGKAYSIRIRRVDEDMPRALVVVGTIAPRDGAPEPVRLTVWTDTDGAGFPKALSVLHRGSRTETVDPQRIALRATSHEAATGGAS